MSRIPTRSIHRTFFAALALASSATALVLGLTGCGGGDDSPAPSASAANVTLSGVAATGAPIANAQVKAVNAKGQSVTTTSAADGSFSISIAESAPYALSVTDSSGKVWYSYAPAGGSVNITPLSTLALAKAFGNKPLSQLVEGWAATRLDAAAVLDAAKTLNANFRTLLQAQGVDYSSFNVFSSAFSANHSGFDAVLDAMRLQFSCTGSVCTEQVTSPLGNTLITWNSELTTAGISLSFTPQGGGGGTTINVNLGACKAAVAGTWSMLVDTTVAGLGGIGIPQICVDGLPGAPTSQAEFCGSTSYAGQLPPGVEIVSCSFAANVGTYDVRISTPIALSYTVKYTFVKR